MKKIFGVLLVAGLAVGIVWQVRKNVLSPTPTENVLGAPVSSSKTLTVEKYKATFFKVQDVSGLSLIPNFVEKISAGQAKEKYGCSSLVSAGFYSEDYKPIGLFISDGKTLSNYQTNSTFNAVLSINDFATPRVTQTTPRDNLPTAVQAGPLLVENAHYLKVTSNDKVARRMVAAVTGANDLYFIAIWDPDSTFSGPTLGELPDVLRQVQELAKVDFADAINLDGGTASTMYTSDVSLSEASPVGGFFCIK